MRDSLDIEKTPFLQEEAVEDAGVLQKRRWYQSSPSGKKGMRVIAWTFAIYALYSTVVHAALFFLKADGPHEKPWAMRAFMRHARVTPEEAEELYLYVFDSIRATQTSPPLNETPCRIRL